MSEISGEDQQDFNDTETILFTAGKVAGDDEIVETLHMILPNFLKTKEEYIIHDETQKLLKDA